MVTVNVWKNNRQVKLIVILTFFFFSLFQDAIDRMIAVEDIFSFSLFLLCCLIPDFPKLLILSTS